MFIRPTVEEFKAYFNRDFPYAPPAIPPAEQDMDIGVTDNDILKAQGEAAFNVNEELFGTQEDFAIGFNLVTAHYLVMDLRASSQGLNGSYSWITSSKSVGSVSESFQVPDTIASNPLYAMFSKTNYGAKYLNIVVLPNSVGAMFISYGATTP